jgi:DNA-binding transcriptional regulator GbsR (MarR family)
MEVLTNEPMTASEVAEKVGVSTQKASALLRQIGGLEVTELKVKGKGKVKGYAIA